MYRNVNAVGPDAKYSSAAAESTKVVVTAPCWLFDVLFSNNSAATVYVQVFDRATALAGAEVPLAEQVVPDDTTAGLSFNRLPMGAGITVAASSTQNSYTAVGAGAGVFTVSYTKK